MKTKKGHDFDVHITILAKCKVQGCMCAMKIESDEINRQTAGGRELWAMVQASDADPRCPPCPVSKPKRPDFDDADLPSAPVVEAKEMPPDHPDCPECAGLDALGESRDECSVHGKAAPPFMQALAQQSADYVANKTEPTGPTPEQIAEADRLFNETAAADDAVHQAEQGGIVLVGGKKE